jgi:thioredoxin reductase/Pyruvate/2-oxoacid:ferredoxin oxidoreductase delta subunit
MEAGLVAYAAPLALIFGVWAYRNKTSQRVNETLLLKNKAAGLGEPASLHPLIDAAKCMGCGSCVSACPENKVIGLVRGEAELIDPTHCIGHGACYRACPFQAIQLVFGSETRGVDIPHVSENFETNMPGVFIAGELGGMGLIRNAVEQGKQALESIARRGVRDGTGNDRLDLVIVGAGPAGFSASLGALEKKLNFVTLEQETLGGTVAHFPRGKLVMTQPAVLPLVGKVRFTETSKEQLLAFWRSVEEQTGVSIHYGERVEAIRPDAGGYIVETGKDSYRTRSVLLAIGRRGTPRKLGVPGEELPKVVYRLIDPEQYKGQRVLVVGGGDSALEAAASIAEQPGAKVLLSYRAEAFTRAKEKNRQRIGEAEKQARLKVLFKSSVKRIGERSVHVDYDGKLLELKNDAVIISAGGVLPTPFLKQIGIEVETKYGTA